MSADQNEELKYRILNDNKTSEDEHGPSTLGLICDPNQQYGLWWHQEGMRNLTQEQRELLQRACFC